MSLRLSYLLVLGLLVGSLFVGENGAAWAGREADTSSGTIHVCDRRHLDATCIEFTVGDMFSSTAEIQRHCSKLGVGGRQPVFGSRTRCPRSDRVGRCVDVRGLLETGKVYGTVHYYSGLIDRWNWEVEGFSPACNELGGRVRGD